MLLPKDQSFELELYITIALIGFWLYKVWDRTTLHESRIIRFMVYSVLLMFINFYVHDVVTISEMISNGEVSIGDFHTLRETMSKEMIRKIDKDNPSDPQTSELLRKLV